MTQLNVLGEETEMTIQSLHVDKTLIPPLSDLEKSIIHFTELSQGGEILRPIDCIVCLY